jgi:NH3-dependent NAD+ synthetase
VEKGLFESYKTDGKSIMSDSIIIHSILGQPISPEGMKVRTMSYDINGMEMSPEQILDVMFQYIIKIKPDIRGWRKKLLNKMIVFIREIEKERGIEIDYKNIKEWDD